MGPATTSMEFSPAGSPRSSSAGPSGLKLNPDEKCAAAQVKVQRLEAVLAAFGDSWSRQELKPMSGQSKNG